MLRRLASLVYRRRYAVVVVWAVFLLASLPLAPRLPGILKPGGYSNASLESQQAEVLLEQKLGLLGNNLVVIYRSPSGLPSDDPRFLQQVDESLSGLQGWSEVRRIISPSVSPRQIAKDHSIAYAVVVLDPSTASSSAAVGELRRRLRPTGLETIVTGNSVFYDDIVHLSEADLRKVELISFPLALVALALVFGSVVAAGVPIVVGGTGVVISLATLFLVGQTTDLSIFVLNLSTMLGLGLGTDYSLFLVNRFREELRDKEVPEALAAALDTAGRAVLFSGLTVFIGLSGLATFGFMMLRSLGISGAVIVAVAVLAALTLLPAILAILGRRVDALTIIRYRPGGGTFWVRLANGVMRRPLVVFFGVLALLALLGSPFLQARFSLPDASVLPPNVPSRQAYDLLLSKFDEGELASILLAVHTDGSPLTPSNVAALYDLTRRLGADPRVARVDSIVTVDPRITLQQYQLIYGSPGEAGDGFASRLVSTLVRGDYTVVTVVPKDPATSSATRSLIRAIRATKVPGLTFLVGGAPAGLLDVVDQLYGEFPYAVALILGLTYVVLFALFRSAVLPLKAVLMNVFSILASYGALVAVFQDGFLSGILGFKALGYVEATTPIVMFCLLFGLSMDYEVFLLSRIQEAYRETGDNLRAVSMGLARSGRVVTSAALIVVVVAGSFAVADVILVKAVGIGTAIAVLVDATVVRALLVPATMRLLGDLNWWSPFPSRADGHTSSQASSEGAVETPR